MDGKTIIKPASTWKIPSSWRLLFGTVVDQTLFHWTSQYITIVTVTIRNITLVTKLSSSLEWTYTLMFKKSWSAFTSTYGYVDEKKKITMPENVSAAIIGNVTPFVCKSCELLFKIFSYILHIFSKSMSSHHIDVCMCNCMHWILVKEEMNAFMKYLSRKLVHLNMMYLYMKEVFFENCVE